LIVLNHTSFRALFSHAIEIMVGKDVISAVDRISWVFISLSTMDCLHG